MHQTKILDIENLQVTQPDLKKETLEFLAENSIDSLPEVWNIQGDYVIADGHHRIRTALEKGYKKIMVLYHSSRKMSIGKAAYEYLVGEIKERAEACRKNKILRVSQMRVL